MENKRVDLRGLPVWERPALVFNAIDLLPIDETFTFVTENEPRGLSARIEQSRRHEIVLEPRRVADSEWHVTLRRTAKHDNHSLSVHGALKRCSAFSSLDAVTLDRVAAGSSMQSARRGHAVVPDGTDWPYLGVLCEGVLALTSGANAHRTRMLYEIFSFEVFGEAEFFDRAMTIGRVVAFSKAARYVRIPRDLVAAVGMEHPQLLLDLGRVASQRTRTLAHALTVAATQPVIARIAHVLIPYAMPEQGLSPVLAPLTTMTQAQIAASAGTVKEVAARAIAELELRKLLRRERGHIHYLDRQRLIDLVRETA